MKPLITPVVNLNGSSKEELVRQQTDILLALRNAVTAMRQASPHGRDFQHLIKHGDWGAHYEALYTAQNAWGERCQMLDHLIEEIEEHAYKISIQGRERAA